MELNADLQLLPSSAAKFVFYNIYIFKAIDFFMEEQNGLAESPREQARRHIVKYR